MNIQGFLGTPGAWDMANIRLATPSMTGLASVRSSATKAKVGRDLGLQLSHLLILTLPRASSHEEAHFTDEATDAQHGDLRVWGQSQFRGPPRASLLQTDVGLGASYSPGSPRCAR